MGISCVEGLDSGSTRGGRSNCEMRGLIQWLVQWAESGFSPGCRGLDEGADEKLMDVESKVGQDIPEESAPPTTALDLVKEVKVAKGVQSRASSMSSS